MSTAQSLYPASPVNLPGWITTPSDSFKKEVKKVLVAIILFFLVYLLMVALATALSIGCIYAGFLVMINTGHFIGIIAGLGIMSTGLMVLIFLVKFIFAVKKYDESGTTLLTEEQQPDLYAFIRQLNRDTQTAFPRKIVVSPEVNACVFYNDSFWSMFFPVKKNLQIGLALVNSLTLSEFKAVMAHEFGHFSQRSMKLGSFVYNVNKAVYNMLYENNNYSSFLQQWANIHWAIGIFVWVTVQMVKGIQIVLRGMYGLINKTYMGLSRQMEFHADAVAASVSGSDNCIAALRKLEISEVCYQTTIRKANEFLKSDTRLTNIYSNHNEVMRIYAEHNHLPIENNTPVADESFFKKLRYHKINIKDQWASHPPLEERAAHLKHLGVDAQKDTRPAWVLFHAPGELQTELTSFLYKSVNRQAKQHIDAAAFTAHYEQDILNLQLPKEYNGFYDDRQMNEIDVDAVMNNNNTDGITISADAFQSLFADEWQTLVKNLEGNEQDIKLLNAIIEKKIKVKTFDYDGQKKKQSEAQNLLEQLTTEIAAQKQQLQQHEEKTAAFFYKAAVVNEEAAATRIKDIYKQHFFLRKKGIEFIASGQKVMDLLGPLFAGKQQSIEQAIHLANGLQDEGEVLQPLIKEFMAMGIYDTDTNTMKKAKEFTSRDFQYFDKPRFLDHEISILHQLLNETVEALGKHQFRSFKSILDYQLQLFKKAVEV
ncbi:MAG: M48 family metalloprotease [Bacteroidetes bacterium]|nr:M48 family metalloprotease [Bacteroidota bacterium]